MSKEIAAQSKQIITLQEYYKIISEEVVKDSFTRAKQEDKKTRYINSVYSLIEKKFTILAFQYRVTEWQDQIGRASV